MGNKKLLIFVVWMVVIGGLGLYVWYPRLFPKKPPVRAQLRQEQPLVIQVAPQAPTAQAPAPAPATPPARQPAPPPKEATPEPAAEAPATPRRYGIEFPPFATLGEADAYQRRLKDAGLPTLRVTSHLDDGLYTLIIGPFPNLADAGEARAQLGARPGGSASPREGDAGFVFSEGPDVLREVVQRALAARGKGYGARIVRAEGRAPLYVIRTAARLDVAQSDKLSGHYRELGFPNRIVAGR
ncbi:MAG: SPOR domain-containing protein [Candidatus Rokubacteria bacterium]|nr:SPOR domain-containing protein [Candidatus Rokubacteria bacterium]